MTGPPRAAHAINWSWRTMAILGAASLVGLIAFFWPFIAAPESAAVAHSADAPWLFALLLPILLGVMATAISGDGLGSKAVALLGVLSALIAALRPLGAGHAGLEPFWFVLIIGGRVLGPAFGFTLGATSIFASALITGGVGPWLPFQMIGAAWVGMGAGLLPRLTGRLEVALLAVYGAVVSILFGFLMNAWFWPFFTGTNATQLSFEPGAPVTENLANWLLFSAATSLGYDLPRAVMTVAMMVLFGGPLLRALRRVSHRASFEPQVAFTPAVERP